MRSLFEGSAEAASGAPHDVFAPREAIIGATIDGFASDLIVVDHNRTGLACELLPARIRLREVRQRPSLGFGMRDITYGPEETRQEWEVGRWQSRRGGDESRATARWAEAP
jgi:predicted glycosyltransferase